MPQILNVITYGVLVVLWASILGLYLRQRREAQQSDPLVAILLSVLALDAFKSVVESTYFGLLWGSSYGVLGKSLQLLGEPAPLTAVKCLNIAVAVLVLTRLVRVWIPSRLAERRAQRAKLEELVRAAGESAERFRVAFNTIPDAVCICKLDDGVNVAVNDGYCQESGWPAEEALGRSALELKLWVDPAKQAELFAGLHAHGYVRDLEMRLRRRDGSQFTALCTSRVFAVGGVRYFLNISRDITWQVRAERGQAALYRIADAASTSGTLHEMLASIHQTLAQLMPVPNFYIALHDARTQTLSFPYLVDERDPQPEGPRPMGKGLTEYVLRTGQPFLHNDASELQPLVERAEVVRTGAPASSWLGVPLRADDRTVGVLATQLYSGETRYGPRDIELLQFVSTQIASAIEKKQAELKLRANEERFRALIENTSDGICLLGADGSVRYASPATGQMLGYERGLAPANLEAFLHPEDAAAVRQKLAESLERPSVPVVAQGRACRKDGSEAVIEGVFTNLLDDAAVRGVVLNLRDLTDRKRMEAQLMMSDRMASVGVLAAGVAHEINNPLAYLIGHLELMADEPAEGAQWTEALEAAREGAERVRQIIRDLKTFSRADETRLGPVDVQKVLDSAVNMARNELRHRAQLVRDDQAGLPPALASEARLGQVVLNLLVNAAQAMPESGGGTVALATRATEHQVIIEVRDTGVGIRPEHRARLFDPFFTTKPAGVGTGLGLYICQQIVGSMGGSISVESEVGKGTTFRVALPIARGPGAQKAGALEALPSQGSRILAVDDEPRIGELLCQVLKAHQVSVVTSASAAYERIRAGERFHLILCDLMMPQMTGMDLHAALAREFPDQARRMVFLTGGAFTVRGREFLDTAAVAHVQKPFEVASMRTLVAKRLAALADG